MSYARLDDAVRRRAPTFASVRRRSICVTGSTPPVIGVRPSLEHPGDYPVDRLPCWSQLLWRILRVSTQNAGLSCARDGLVGGPSSFLRLAVDEAPPDQAVRQIARTRRLIDLETHRNRLYVGRNNDDRHEAWPSEGPKHRRTIDATGARGPNASHAQSSSAREHP